MMSDYYSKETVDAKFDNICDTQTEIKNAMKDGFAGVHARQDKTNGRISALEKWRWLMTGIAIALGALSIPNVSTIAKLFSGI